MTPEQWQQIQDLFQGALEQPEPSRDAWLEAQITDPTVLTDVRALLRADASGGHRLISGAIADSAASLRSTMDHAPVSGARVGPYRLLEELGHGGMGTVYLAERADDQYRARVAIKFVRGHFGAPELARRLLLERQILANLTHPNIAWLIDGGATDDGTPYLVMEYIDGEPIDTWCDRVNLGMSGRIALFRTVCEAVRFAHSSLVVHRDIKPPNILVSRDGTPKLVDFGVAKLLAGEGATDATATMRFLTPAYAAPEQLRGERITVATDVFALGGVLYRLLTGKPPLDTAGLSAAALEHQITEVMPPLPSAVARSNGRAWARRLEGDLDTIILTALQRDPARRYPSVERLIDDLRRHASRLPVSARPDTVGYRAGKFVHRHRAGVAITAGAALTLALLLGWHTTRITSERNLAQVEGAKAREVAGFLQRLFAMSDPGTSRGETVTARELLDAGAARITTELADQPDVQATLMRTIGEVYSTLGLRTEAGPLIERAYLQHRELHGTHHPESVRSELVFAIWLQDVGRNDEAAPRYRNALAVRSEMLGPRHPDVGEAHRHLAYLLESAGEVDSAEVHFRAALEIARDASPMDESELASALARLGRLLRAHDRLDEAEPLLREALTMQRRVFGAVHPDVASSARNLAALLREQGKFDASDTLYQEAIRLRRTLFGAGSQDVALTLNSYATMLQSRGAHDSALSVMRTAVEMLERFHEAPHTDLAAAYSNIGSQLIAMRRPMEAVPYFERSLAILDQVLPSDHPNRAYPLLFLAEVHADAGRYAEAEPLQRRALMLRRRALPAEHRLIAEAAGDLGATLAATNRRREADSLLEESHRIWVVVAGSDDPRTQRAKERLEEFRKDR